MLGSNICSGITESLVAVAANLANLSDEETKNLKEKQEVRAECLKRLDKSLTVSDEFNSLLGNGNSEKSFLTLMFHR